MANDDMELSEPISSQNKRRRTGKLKLSEIHEQKCPVCGKTTVEEYGICDICGWENDPVQSWTPTLSGGANRMSLEEAKEAYRKGMPIE